MTFLEFQALCQDYLQRFAQFPIATSPVVEVFQSFAEELQSQGLLALCVPLPTKEGLGFEAVFTINQTRYPVQAWSHFGFHDPMIHIRGTDALQCKTNDPVTAAFFFTRLALRRDP